MRDIMIKTYAVLVQAGRRTLESVPDDLREDVAAMLEGDKNA